MEEKYYGNYRGFVLYNADKSHSGRVKVWVPEVNGRNFSIRGGDDHIGGLSRVEVDDWVNKLPWAVTAQSLVGGGGGSSQYNGTSFQVGDGVQFTGGNVGVSEGGKVDKEELRAFLNKEIKGSKLVGVVPSDAAKYNIDGSSESWANFFVALAGRESSYNVGTTGDLGRADIPQGSHGLFQLSPNDALNYRLQSEPFTLGQLQDPVVNSKTTIVIAERLLGRDNVIAGGSDAGLSRYWGPLRRDELTVPPVPPYTPTTPTNASPLVPDNEPTEPAAPIRTQKAAEAFSPSYNNFRVTSDTRDVMGGSSNVKKRGRPISLDFNSAGGGAGIMIVAPSDATEEELELCSKYVQGVSDFFAEHSSDPKSKKINSNPVRIKGIDNKRGIDGFFHTEPFDQDSAAMEAIRRHPQQYASVIASTLGKIPNALILPPHQRGDGGAAFDNTNERDFALEYIIPFLASADGTQVIDAFSAVGNTHPEKTRDEQFLQSLGVPQSNIDEITKVGEDLYKLRKKNSYTVGGGDREAVKNLEEQRDRLWLNLPIDDEQSKELKTKYVTTNDLNYSDVPMATKVNPAAMSYGGNNYSNVTKGSFTIPDVGAKVWVFFEGGDKDSPVVFAANPSTQDYAGIYDIGSESINYPVDKEGDEATVIRDQYVMNNRGGSVEMVGTTGNERVKISSFHGNSVVFDKTGTREHCTGNKSALTHGDSFNTVQGDNLLDVTHDNSVVIRGDNNFKCGDVRANVETAQKMMDLHAPIHDKVALFDIQRTDASHPLDSSPLQTKSGSNRDCEVCSSGNEIPTQTSSPSKFTPASVSGGSGTKETLEVGVSKVEGRTVTVAACTCCDATGVSKTSAEGRFDRDPKKAEIPDDINAASSEMSDLENELGDGGHDNIYVTKSQNVTIGPLMNTLQSIRVDPNGKRALVGQEPSSDGKTVAPLHVPVPHVETVSVNSLAGGDYSMMAANKYNLMVGANGINMKTLGEYNMQGRLLTVAAEQINISSNNQVTVDGGKNISLKGDSVTITARSQNLGGAPYKSIALDGTTSVSNNVVVKGGMHVEGQASIQHLTAPLEYQETETTLSFSDQRPNLKIGKVVIPSGSSAGTYDVISVAATDSTVSAHSHTFANAPMTLVPTNDDVRKNASVFSQAQPVMAQPVKNGYHGSKKHANIRYWNPRLFELYADCDDNVNTNGTGGAGTNGSDIYNTDLERVVEGITDGTPVEELDGLISRASDSSISVTSLDKDCEV